MNEFENIIIQKIDQLIKVSTNNSGWIQNLISTVAGVILGTILTILTQRIGKLKYYVVSASAKYYKNISGAIREVKLIESPNSCHIEIVIDFQNTSQINIGIRNICIEIHQKKKDILKIGVEDDDTKRAVNYGIRRDPLETVNIEPHSILRKKCIAYLDQEKVNNLIDAFDIYFVFINDKNRRKRVRILV